VPIVWWVVLLFCWFSFKFQVSSCANYTKWYTI
jgi:hypothetical protein